MRSQTHHIPLNKNIFHDPFTTEPATRKHWLTVHPDGSFTVDPYPTAESATFHLDTDKGFEYFMKLIGDNAMHNRLDEIKKALYING